jgi:hypothetical protein
MSCASQGDALKTAPLPISISPDAAVFDALATLGSLTAVTLGTLPLDQPPPGGPAARLPRVASLTAASPLGAAPLHAPQWAGGAPPRAERQRQTGADGSHTARWVAALCAFPNLESLTLDTVAASRDSLLALPRAAPRLRELLLPPRLLLGAGAGALEGLGALSALTRLRVGWKSALHEGPPQDYLEVGGMRSGV